MNQQTVENQLKIVRHYADLFKVSGSVNPVAARKLSAAVAMLEKEIFPDSEKKKPTRNGVGT